MEASNLVSLFYMVTFGEPNYAYMFETEPPEGYAYWRRKAFWEDMQVFGTSSALALITASVPVVALVRHWMGGRRSRAWSVGIAIAAALLTILPSIITVSSNYAPRVHWVYLAPAALVLGCLYAMVQSILVLRNWPDH